MYKQKTWFLKRRSWLYFGSKEMSNSLVKFKGSLFAVIFGLIIACFVIIGSGQNAITYFQFLLKYAFTSWPTNNWDNTLVWWAIYIVAGLALVVSFRSGMFNIGVAGQMLAAGAVVIAIGIRYDLSQPLAIIVALVAGILAAVLVALVTVLLKVFFNVHEVVTSILLNWTIWYLVKWLFKISNGLYDSDHGTSINMHDSMSMSISGYNFILPLLIALVLIVAVWFLLKKTTLGYKIRTVGLNPFAATYSGINQKYYCIISFVLSGALAGVMAVIYYIAKNPSISFLTDDLPTIGFDSIAVALVGQISAIGVVGSAFIWGLIKSGGSIGSVLGLPTATGDIIFGVIIYSAACAVLLSRLQPIKFLIRYLNIAVNSEARKITNGFIAKMYQYFIETFKIKKHYRKLKVALIKTKRVKIKKLKTDYQEMITKKQKLKQEINDINIDINHQLQLITNNKNNKVVINKEYHQAKVALIKTKRVKIKKLKTDYQQMITNKSVLEVKALKQKLKQEINNINIDINHQLQLITNNKNDKVGVTWAQFFQEKKALTHYIYKQYNTIWKKGKLGKWNKFQQEKKNIYAESLNMYINEKMKYENTIYTYKQDLNREVALLKKQKAILDKSRIKDVIHNMFREINKLRQTLNNDLKSLKKQIIKTTDQNNKQQLILKKQEMRSNYKKEVKTLIKQAKINRKQLKAEAIPIRSNINILNKQFSKNIVFEAKAFKIKFNDIFQNEQRAIIKIKNQRKEGKLNGSV